MSGQPLNPSHPLDSSTDHRSVLEVVSWTLGIVTAVIVACRLGTKFKVSGIFALDDVFIVCSLILALCQTGSLSVAASHGLGRLNALPQDQVEVQAKAVYAFNILFIFSQSFAKLSILVFIRSLTPVPRHRNLCGALSVGTSVWAVVSVFASAFQCRLPFPWRNEGCIDRTALVVFIGIVNITLDTGLVIVPTLIVWGLQQKLSRKMIVIATFFSRVGVIVAIIMQLVVIYRPQGATASSNMFLSWTYALLIQIVEYTSIASACGPYLKPFLENIGSGMIASDDLARRSGGNFILSTNRRSAKNVFGNGQRGLIDSVQIQLQGLGGHRGTNETTIVADRSQKHKSRADTWDSSNSQRSTTGFIQQTTTYQVTRELA